MISRIVVVSLAALIVVILCIPALSGAQNGSSHDYSVTIRETGLPSGTHWSVSVHGFSEYSNSSTISFMEPNGTYVFTIGGVRNYRPLPSNFSISVQGHNISLVVVWAPILYSVTFIETGLPADTFWNVTFGNQTNISPNSTIDFNVMNGTYDYSIPSVNGITPSSPNGTISVSGNPTKVFVTFISPVNFTFIEQGLPSGSYWSVWINGLYHNSTSPEITVMLPNGTYNFIIVVPSNYHANPSSGRVNWSDNVIYVITSSYLYYELIIGVLVALIAVFLIVFLKMRKKLKRSTED